MGNWVNIKPKFNKECILLTASFYSNTTYYSAYWIKKEQSDEDGFWYWGWFTIEGDEYGDINDLTADMYKMVNLPTK